MNGDALGDEVPVSDTISLGPGPVTDADTHGTGSFADPLTLHECMFFFSTPPYYLSFNLFS